MSRIVIALGGNALGSSPEEQQEMIEAACPSLIGLISQGQFAAGSMLPKVQAAMAFAESKKGRNAVIASLEKAPLAMVGKSGTRIYQG